MSRRALCIGLDAAEWDLVERLLDQGRLPRLASLAARGTVRRLHNEMFRDPRVWPQFITGTRPVGVSSWCVDRFDPASYDVFLGRARPSRPFWTAPGVRPIVVDMPMLALQDDLPGVHVSYCSHGGRWPRASRPRGLLGQVDRLFGPHTAAENDYTVGWHSGRHLRALRTALLEGIRRRTDVVQWLMDQTPDWNLAVVVMSEAHSAGEFMWHGVDPDHVLHGHRGAGDALAALEDVYVALDEAIGRLDDAAADDTDVVVFALHGMRSSHGDTATNILLPELLRRLEGGSPLLGAPDRATWRSAGMPPIVPRRFDDWVAHVERFAPSSTTSFWREELRRAVPPSVLEWIDRARRGTASRPRGPVGNAIAAEDERPSADVLADEFSFRLPVVWYREGWPSMRFFVLPSFGDGLVRLNLQGRESSGLVRPEDRDAVLDELEAELWRCTNPRTGEPVVDGVRRLHASPDEAYADLVVQWRGQVDALTHPTLGTIGPYALNRTGTHTPHGFVVAAGPGIPHGSGEDPASALALPPTLLAHIGLAVDDLQGGPVWPSLLDADT